MSDVPVPQHCPSPRELDDLDVLSIGALAGGRFEADGLVTLTVPTAVGQAAGAAGQLELVDPEGLPLARLDVEATYPVTDAGTAGSRTGLTGAVRVLSHHEFGPFRGLYLTPGEVRERHPAEVLTVPVTAPLTDRDLTLVREHTGPVLLLVLAGTGTPRGVSSVGLVRATLAAATLLPDATVTAVALATLDDPGRDAARRQQVLDAFAPGPVLEVPGDGDLPEEIAGIVRQDRPGPGGQGLVLFFTGLSGSGKSTLARALHDRLLEAGRRTVTSLDGDVVRRNLSAGLTFSKADRETNIRRIGWVAAEVSRHGGVAICSPIAPYDETRKQVRAMTEEAGGAFVLVHVATPLEECERRDRKGLYAKARRGEIPEFTGISSPYEEPEDATVRVDTTGRSIEDALADVLAPLATQLGLEAAPYDAPPDAPAP